MRKRTRWLLVGLAVALVVGAIATIPALPQIVRFLALARIQAMTGRAATMDSLALDLRRGTLSVRGFRLADRDGETLGTIGQLDARIRLRALLTGHLWLHDLAIRDSTVRVVRYSNNEFNISDLIQSGGGGAALNVTVDRFTLGQGTVVLEDQSLSPGRVWKSEDLALSARNVSTRRDDGEAEGSSTINGAPVSVRVEQLRLKPVHLRAVVRAEQVDLALARLYLPADAPVVLERGRLETTVTVAIDARTGVHVDVDGQIADATLIRRQQRDPFLVSPNVRLAVRELTVGNDGSLAVGRVEIDGASTFINAEASPPARFDLPRVTLRAEGLAWPVRGPARVELASKVPGGGELSVRGTVSAQPASADVDVRVTRVNLTPWARYAAPWLRVTGTGELALNVQAALQPVLTATGKGTARATGLVVADGPRRVLALEHAEVSGLEFQWPSRVTLGRIRLRRPDMAVERDAGGAIVIPGVRAGASPVSEGPVPVPATSSTSPLTVAVNELAIEDGAVTWRDLAVKPATTLRVTGVRLLAHDAKWPVAGPVALHLRAAAPQGGTVEVSGRVGIQPLTADVQLKARSVALAPYASYVPLRLPVRGYADASVSAVVSRDADLQARVRGVAGLSRISVVDGKRQVLSADRIEARGVDVEWPQRVAVERLTLRQPWALVERDEHGAFPLRSMVSPPGQRDGEASPAVSAASPPSAGARSITVGQLVIEDGGARVVDRSITPPYAEDMSRVWVRTRGLTTDSEKPAQLELRAMIGSTGVLTARGRVSAFDGPFYLDLNGELREHGVPRLNPYLRHYVGWSASEGRVSTKIVCRVSGDELTAKTETQLGRLQVVRTGQADEARQRIGLPLGLIVALLKDKNGNIRLSLPVGGHVNDPRFDFQEAIWSAVRAITIKTIALPVSWVGRLRLSPDSKKIQDVEIDPVGFETGVATVAPGDVSRLDRLASFMHNLPDVRMVVTPVVSLGDIEALKARAIETRIKALATERKISELEAARLLYLEQFSRKEPPGEIAQIVAALQEVAEPPAAEAGALAKQRAQTVRDALKKAGVQPDRIAVNKDTGGLDTLEAGRVEFGVTDQVKPKRTLADLLRMLVERIQRRVTAMHSRS